MVRIKSSLCLEAAIRRPKSSQTKAARKNATISKTTNRNLIDSSFRQSVNKLETRFSSIRFHRVRDSLLSSASGYTNYRGILNLCVVLLVMSSGRLVLENIIKYGFLVRFDIPLRFVKDPNAWPSLLALTCTICGFI